MNFFFSILSVAYIAGIFLWADSPMVSVLAPFNPYSLLHIPLYGILTVLLILSFMPFKLKRNNATNPINSTNSINAKNASPHRRISTSTHSSFFIPGVFALIIGIADEIHQSFIPTRDASIIDVFLDFIGIILALFLIYHIYKKQVPSQL